jgi:hypothetical protein
MVDMAVFRGEVERRPRGRREDVSGNLVAAPQRAQELEGAGGVRAQRAASVVHAALAEGHAAGAVQQPPVGHQPPRRGPQEAGLHLDGDDARHAVLVGVAHAARRMGHHHVQQRHQDAAVRDGPRVLHFGTHVQADLRLAGVEAPELHAQRLDERDVQREGQWHSGVHEASRRGPR